ATAVRCPSPCLPAWCEAQPRTSPKNTAVAFQDPELSYAQLNSEANRLAHQLMALGAGPERIVALALPRCPELIIAVLAVLKAGAAYLPLDPDYPPRRLEFMLTDSHPTLLLTTTSTAPHIPDHIATPRL